PSTQQIDHTLHRLRLLTVLAALAAAALAAPASLLMTRRVLRPLAQLSSDASVIGQTADPSRRLATSSRADEVAALADALNAMLAALERARDGARRLRRDRPRGAKPGRERSGVRHAADHRLRRPRQRPGRDHRQ